MGKDDEPNEPVDPIENTGEPVDPDEKSDDQEFQDSLVLKRTGRTGG